MSLCKYKDYLGIPNQGIHNHVMGLAWKNITATLICGFLIAQILHPRTFKTAQNIPTLFYLLYNFIQINRILLIGIV